MGKNIPGVAFQNELRANIIFRLQWEIRQRAFLDDPSVLYVSIHRLYRVDFNHVALSEEWTPVVKD